MPSWKAKKLGKRMQEKVLLEPRSRFANSIRRFFATALFSHKTGAYLTRGFKTASSQCASAGRAREGGYRHRGQSRVSLWQEHRVGGLRPHAQGAELRGSGSQPARILSQEQ